MNPRFSSCCGRIPICCGRPTTRYCASTARWWTIVAAPPARCSWGGREIGAEQRISINWIAANRDPAVFPEPDRFSLDRDPALNLLYGAGIHVCPGAPLARMELVIAIKALLQHSEQLRLVEAQPARLASYPSSGYASLPLQLR